VKRLIRHFYFCLPLAMGLGIEAQAQSDNNYGFQHQGSLRDEVLYSIGGGQAVTMTPASSMYSIGVGAGWNSNLICGDMSITATLQNQLNGITQGFQNIMSSVIQNATQAVASLPALIIQRADPGLYNLLTNGVLQARLDFDRSKLTCRAIAEKMADAAGGQAGWGQLSEGFTLKNAVSSGNDDAVAAVEEAEGDKGNNGVTWVGGDNAGGENQPPVRVVGDTTRAGYNLLNGRAATETGAMSGGACTNLICRAWPSPGAASAWATRVLGEREQRTCDTCTKTQTTPGVGLMPLIQQAFDDKLQALRELVQGETTTAERLEAAGSRYLPVTRGVIEALRDEPDREVLTERLASEAALANVLEKALLLQRTLLAGRKEPNVAANDLAVQAIDQEIDVLAREIDSLKTELELRRALTGNAALAIVQRHAARAGGSRGIYEGDPVRNRLDALQRPAAGATP
jgi:integrating conjugative element protein (TIGR03755 family)